MSPLKFTTFASDHHLTINTKHVASTFGKSQRFHDQQYDDKVREKKRRCMMASEEEWLGKEEINVIQSAPSGSVQPRFIASSTSDDTTTDQENNMTIDVMNRTIIIHPGSKYLRMGRASDAFPVQVPNVIARKITAANKYENGKGKGKEQVVPVHLMSLDAGIHGQGTTTTGETSLDDLDVTAKINSLRGDLRARLRMYKLRAPMMANESVLSFNNSTHPEKVADYNDPESIEWVEFTDEEPGEEYYIGDKATRIADPTGSGYVLRYPYDRGTLNTTGYVSSQELINDIERIWIGTLEEELGIKRSELKDYSAILLIPDLYDQIYVREMSRLILNDIGFKQMCIQQESVCATFGAGLVTACVIDIGAKTTSISCIEEGLILPETRMVLDFGGDDITEFLSTLLMRSGFPYRELDLKRSYDFKMMDQLKQKMIVLSEADVTVNTFEFYTRKPGSRTSKYEVKVYDDVILAPYALFSPRVIDFDKKQPVEQKLWSALSSDGVDLGGSAITKAMKDSTQHLWSPVPLPVLPSIPSQSTTTSTSVEVSSEPSSLPKIVFKSFGTTTTPGSIVTLPPVSLPSMDSTESSPQPLIPLPPSVSIPSTIPAVAAPPLPTSPDGIDLRAESGKIPLHVAVVHSILAAATEDRMRRICNNVLVVGGGGLIHNIGFAIESRASPLLATQFPALTNTFKVAIPTEISPKILAWKGITVLCKLDVANEVWVRKEEYEMMGMKVVRERGVFFL